MEEVNKNKSIKRRILLLVIGITFLISFLLSFLIGNVVKKEVEDRVGESLLKVSKNITDILDRETYDRFRELELFSSLPTITDENVENSEKRKLLDLLKEDLNHYAWIGLTDTKGNVIAGSDGYLEGKNASIRPWFSKGLEGSYIGDIHDALLLSKLLPNKYGDTIYLYDVAHHVKNKEGKTIGVLCAHLSFNWVRDFLKNLEIENNIEIFLLSNDNTIITKSNNLMLSPLSEFSTSANDFVNGGESYKSFAWDENSEYITAIAKSQGFKGYEGFGWKIMVRMPSSIAYESASDIQDRIIVYGLVLGFFFLLLGSIFAARIVTPIVMLCESAQKITSKTAGAEAIPDFKTGDEIQVLSSTLKQMVKSLEKEANEKEIAQEKVLLSATVFEESNDGIIICNKDNEIILVNKAFTNYTGYSVDDVIGKNPKFLSSGENTKEFYMDMWSSLKEKNKWKGKITNKRKDGSIYEELLSIRVILNNKDEIISYIAVFSNITDIKKVLKD